MSATSTRKRTFAFATVAFGAAAVLYACVQYPLSFLYEAEPYLSETSGDLSVTILRGSAGATTGFSYPIVVHRADEPARIEEQTGRLDKVHELSLHWISADRVLVCAPKARVWNFSSDSYPYDDLGVSVRVLLDTDGPCGPRSKGVSTIHQVTPGPTPAT